MTTPIRQGAPTRSSLYYLIYTVEFGVALAVGGGVLEPFAIPILLTSFASVWVCVLISLNKLVLQRQFSVMLMYCVASPIAMVTAYLGPPSPLKIIFIVAGLSFDLGSSLRTTTLKLRHLLLGHLAATITGFLFTWVIYYIHTPDLALKLKPIFLIASLSHFAISVLISCVLYKMIPPGSDAPEVVRRIRSHVSIKLPENNAVESPHASSEHEGD